MITAKAAFEQYFQKNFPLLSPDTSAEKYRKEVDRVYKRVHEGNVLVGDTETLRDKEAELKMRIRIAGSAVERLQAASKSAEVD